MLFGTDWSFLSHTVMQFLLCYDELSDDVDANPHKSLCDRLVCIKSCITMHGDFILSIPAIPAIALGQDDSLGQMVNDFHGDPLGKITILLKLSLYEGQRQRI